MENWYRTLGEVWPYLRKATIPKRCVLTGSEDYNPWVQNCENIFNSIPALDIMTYIETGSASFPGVDDPTPHYDMIVDCVIRNTVDAYILKEFAGASGRERFLQIRDKYKHVSYLLARVIAFEAMTKLSDKSLTLADQIEVLKGADPRVFSDIMKVLYLDYLTLEDEDINNYFTNIKSVKCTDGNFILPTWDEVLEKVSNICTKRELDRLESNDADTPRPVQCFKCKGFGHIVKRCESKHWFDENGNIRTSHQVSNKTNVQPLSSW